MNYDDWSITGTTLGHEFIELVKCNSLSVDEMIALDTTDLNSFMAIYFARSLFVREIGFAIPYSETITGLARHIGNRKAIEVCAGTGWFTKLLQEVGVDIIGVDNYSKSYHGLRETGDSVSRTFLPKVATNIQSMDAIEAVIAHPSRDVILACWVDLDSNLDCHLVEAMKPGQELILIGEVYGCTGSKEFFDKYELNELEIPYRSWHGIHDSIYSYIK